CASIVKAKVIQIVPGVVKAKDSYIHAYDAAQESLNYIAEEASKQGIIIGVENVYNKFLPSPLEFTKFIDEIQHDSLKVYLNIGNALASGFPEHWINLAKGKIITVHAKDYSLAIDDFVPAYTGDV